MSQRFTIQQLEQLQAEGKIQGFTGIIPETAEKYSAKPAKNIPKQDTGVANKRWLHDTLSDWCDAHGLLLIREHTFCERGWRLDWAVFNGREKVVAVEYEGIFSKKSRHTTLAGFTNDCDKYRAAALEGWKVLRYTAKNYETILSDLMKL